MKTGLSRNVGRHKTGSKGQAMQILWPIGKQLGFSECTRLMLLIDFQQRLACSELEQDKKRFQKSPLEAVAGAC